MTPPPLNLSDIDRTLRRALAFVEGVDILDDVQRIQLVHNIRNTMQNVILHLELSGPVTPGLEWLRKPAV